jgi:hypothetical protein
MMHYLEEWLARKCGRPQLSIREERSARFKLTRHLGPRGQFAVVHIRGEPANTFGFASVVEWPSPECDYTAAVLDGILDELFAADLGHVAGKVHFTLEKIEWHDVDSSAVAFYHAARGAVREILGRDWFSDNIDYQGLTNG